ncbi:related to syntaxin family member TLG1 [Phialocephala subalpina]|uniref:t-SNARE affecting a late Golgi compartment protein 1 n=1 Tax=Phialocephala subalpina TaxID=576137 RepID=A0A1L7XVN7_9HELO|nr:related to syntaxin family member TLG1 [Phialocephala subalpina]
MMSSTNEEDPFLQVQADVLSALSHTRPLFTSYLRIRSLSTLPNSPELLSARAELETSLSSLAEDLADLIESVKAVQSDPYKFGLEIDEVARRARLVDEVGGEVEDMREELEKSIQNTNTNAQNGNGNGKGIDDGNRFGDDERDRDYNAEFEHEQQLTMMRDQDRDLDSVFHTVGNLRQQADTMGRELEEQAEMLETADNLADRVGGRLQTGMKRMNEVIRRNEDGLSSCCIGVLIFVLILLLVLVLIL